MLEVRENEIALRKLSGGVAQLRTLAGTLPFSISIDEGVPLKWVLEGYFSKEGPIVDFPGVGQQYFCKGAKSGKITFSPLETKETTFLQTCLPFC